MNVTILSIATLLLPFALSLIFSTAHAQPTTIRIVSDEIAQNFPYNIEFTLGAEDTYEITEISIRFKSPASDIWTYGYPNFVPGRQVKARYKLNTNGSMYVAPGTDLKYFYVITNSNGQLFTTEPQIITYLDTRFTWNTTDKGSLRIMWHETPANDLKQISAELSISINRIRAILGTESTNLMKGIIYNTSSEGELAFPPQSSTLTMERIFQGFAFPEWGIFLGIGLQTDLIVHEVSHLLMSQVVSSPGATIPSWVNEGFANYVASEGSSRYRISAIPGIRNHLYSMPLRNMNSIPGKANDIHAFYEKSESVVRFMINEFGEVKFREFLKQLNHRTRPDDALKSSYGFGINELEGRWFNEYPRVGMPDQAKFPYWSLSNMLIGGMVILTAIMVFIRLVFTWMSKSAQFTKGHVSDE